MATSTQIAILSLIFIQSFYFRIYLDHIILLYLSPAIFYEKLKAAFVRSYIALFIKFRVLTMLQMKLATFMSVILEVFFLLSLGLVKFIRLLSLGYINTFTQAAFMYIMFYASHDRVRSF